MSTLFNAQYCYLYFTIKSLLREKRENHKTEQFRTDDKPRFMLSSIPWVFEQPQRTNSGECKNSKETLVSCLEECSVQSKQPFFSSYCDVVLSVTQSYCDSASLYTSILDQRGVCSDSSGLKLLEVWGLMELTLLVIGV